MLPRPAQYLLRIDDLCPTISPEPWRRLQSLIEEFQIKPILAVVPDNRDPELELSFPDFDFWPRMRPLESSGAAIALHGYRHLCLSSGRSLIPLHRQSEFSGVPSINQQDWIRKGLAILRGYGLNPWIWAAPRHGFDRRTLRVLREEGIEILSDGLARIPFVRGGLTWIPQQLWAPIEKSSGLWTICVHPNTITESQIVELRAFLARNAAQFTSVDRVLQEFHPAPLGFTESIYGAIALRRIQSSRIRSKLFQTVSRSR